MPFVEGGFVDEQIASLETLGQCLDASCVDVLALNTGRSLDSSLIIADAINSEKLKYIVAEHGAVGYRLDTQELIDFELLSRELPELQPFYQSVVNIPKLITWYQERGMQQLALEIGYEIEAASKIANLTLPVPEGVCGKGMNKVLKELIEFDSPMAGHLLVYHHSVSDGYVDIMTEVDKGTGARLICQLESEYCAESELETFAVGNGTNDVSLFQVVDNIICPQNSDQEIIDICSEDNGLVSEFAYVDATTQWLKSLG
ncbi:MAG: HAD hydrolase family protein [bacterium]